MAQSFTFDALSSTATQAIASLQSLATQAEPYLGRLLALAEEHPGSAAGGAFVCYLVLCRALRFRRTRKKLASYPYRTRADYRHMTAQHAFEIHKYLFELEFPLLANRSLEFALFRTYGIPTISRLLVATKQLSTPEFAPKRYVDTEVITGEFMSFAPGSERANTAIARLNYIHSMYRASGKISNDDMLFTLALLVLEPVRWIDRYEWRKLTDLERCAFGTFWKSVGDAMEISYHELKSAETGWTDGLHWFEELEEWTKRYEETYMVPDVANKKTADETTAILLWDVPKAMRPFAFKVVSSLMDDRLRKAMMFKKNVHLAFRIRAFFIRHFALPRPWFLRFQRISEKPNKYGKTYLLEWQNEPWYLEPTFFNRWGPKAWFRWAMGRPYPAVGKYGSEGFDIQRVGPAKFDGKGLSEIEKTKSMLMAQGRSGCPFAFSGKH
ncbi:hypothetical protein JOL62DRAFT_560556 [Phyllosticta paracitricarpa]|uniref:ER-bound oxygenase mpaB/mpaB'/Rubber oxygenase catalytic domain-containing protein n=1 Tax=Phyllosticta paracitricarpa TaxID=2016321 RepID=A0ABR1MSW7_9PEZI